MNIRKIMFSVLSILVGFILSITFLEIICRILPVSDSFHALPVNSLNPIMRFEENRDVTWSSGPFFSIITKKHINNYGFFNDQNYNSDDKSPLLAIIGDSYVAAAQVDNKNSMHGILSKETINKGRVYSFGSSGSSLSNYLAYANYVTEKFHATAIVFIIVGNDFDESLTKYKNAPGFYYFSNSNENLDLIRIDYNPTLIKRVSRYSSLIRYLSLNIQFDWRSIDNIFHNYNNTVNYKFIGNTSTNTNKERILDSQKAILKFFEELPLRTSLSKDKILFIIDGIRPELYNQETLKKANDSYFNLMRNYFIKVSINKGYEIIDMQPIFIETYQSKKIKFEFPTDAHWNEAGHSLVAKKIKESTVYRSVFNN